MQNLRDVVKFVKDSVDGRCWCKCLLAHHYGYCGKCLEEQETLLVFLCFLETLVSCVRSTSGSR